MDFCFFCDGTGIEQTAESWSCDVCGGTGLVDERKQQMEYACAGSSEVPCRSCGQMAYLCECEEVAW